MVEGSEVDSVCIKVTQIWSDLVREVFTAEIAEERRGTPRKQKDEAKKSDRKAEMAERDRDKKMGTKK